MGPWILPPSRDKVWVTLGPQIPLSLRGRVYRGPWAWDQAAFQGRVPKCSWGLGLAAQG